MHESSHCRLFVVVLLLVGRAVVADDFHVRIDGKDDANRDGRTTATAWASLAFACEQVPEGEHGIHLGPGEFVTTRTAYPESGVTVTGSGHTGEQVTRLLAARDWSLSEMPCEGEHRDEYLIALHDRKQVTIRNLVLASDPEHRITGGIFVRGGEEIELAQLHVHDFRWNGLNLSHAHHLDVHHCRIENASTDKCRYHGGLIRTTWIKDSELHHNEIVSTIGGGYGYKGGGHERVRLHHNRFAIDEGFAIESAHEHEFGLEIDHNVANRCISVPKGGQSADPTTRGCEYSVHVHHNLLTDSYTVEGPRNHLRIDHNWIRIEKPNGRCYTHHGGINNGPVTIDHNVVENLDRSFVWMNEGLAENIAITHNTVFCADAADRTGSILGAYSAERLNGWVVRNNVFVCPADKPRRLFDDARGVGTKITATGNVCLHVTGVPKGNFADTEPGLRSTGEKPWPFYAPNEGGFVVDRGVDLGETFEGRAPDVGAYEFGVEEAFPEFPEAATSAAE